MQSNKSIAEIINSLNPKDSVSEALKSFKKSSVSLVDPAACDKEGKTPFMCAVIKQNLVAVQWLFEPLGFPSSKVRDLGWGVKDKNNMTVMMHLANVNDQKMESKAQSEYVVIIANVIKEFNKLSLDQRLDHLLGTIKYFIENNNIFFCNRIIEMLKNDMPKNQGLPVKMQLFFNEAFVASVKHRGCSLEITKLFSDYAQQGQEYADLLFEAKDFETLEYLKVKNFPIKSKTGKTALTKALELISTGFSNLINERNFFSNHYNFFRTLSQAGITPCMQDLKLALAIDSPTSEGALSRLFSEFDMSHFSVDELLELRLDFYSLCKLTFHCYPKLGNKLLTFGLEQIKTNAENSVEMKNGITQLLRDFNPTIEHVKVALECKDEEAFKILICNTKAQPGAWYSQDIDLALTKRMWRYPNAVAKLLLNPATQTNVENAFSIIFDNYMEMKEGHLTYEKEIIGATNLFKKLKNFTFPENLWEKAIQTRSQAILDKLLNVFPHDITVFKIAITKNNTTIRDFFINREAEINIECLRVAMEQKDYKTLQILLALDLIKYQQADAKYDSDDERENINERRNESDPWGPRKKAIYKGDTNPNKKAWYKSNVDVGGTWHLYPDYIDTILDFYQDDQDGVLSQHDIINILRALDKKKFPVKIVHFTKAEKIDDKNIIEEIFNLLRNCYFASKHFLKYLLDDNNTEYVEKLIKQGIVISLENWENVIRNKKNNYFDFFLTHSKEKNLEILKLAVTLQNLDCIKKLLGHFQWTPLEITNVKRLLWQHESKAEGVSRIEKILTYYHTEPDAQFDQMHEDDKAFIRSLKGTAPAPSNTTGGTKDPVPVQLGPFVTQPSAPALANSLAPALPIAEVQFPQEGTKPSAPLPEEPQIEGVPSKPPLVSAIAQLANNPPAAVVVPNGQPANQSDLKAANVSIGTFFQQPVAPSDALKEARKKAAMANLLNAIDTCRMLYADNPSAMTLFNQVGEFSVAEFNSLEARANKTLMNNSVGS